MKIKSVFKALGIGLLISILGIVLSLTPFGIYLEENFGLDWLFQTRGAVKSPEKVVIVSIDKESAKNLGVPEKTVQWPRTLHSDLIQQLNRQGARAIGFDVLFKDERNIIDNEVLATTLARAGNVVLFQYINKRFIHSGSQSITSSGDASIEELITPLPELANAAAALAPFPLPKIPAKVSQYWTFKPSAGGVPTMPVVMMQVYGIPVYPQFYELLSHVDPQVRDHLPSSYELSKLHRSVTDLTMDIRDLFLMNKDLANQLYAKLKSPESNVTDQKTLGIIKALIKMYSLQDSVYLNYYGPARTIETIPYHKAVRLYESLSQKDQYETLKDKVILVGLSEPVQLEQYDTFYTPFTQDNGVNISGVEIMATAFANLIEDNTIISLTTFNLIVLLLFWGLLIGFIGRLLTAGWAVSACAVLGILFIVVSYQLFARYSLWIPIIAPIFIELPLGLFIAVFSRYVETKSERQKIRNAFGYYLPNQVVDEITENFANQKSSSRLVFGTCMATDASKYTTLAETMAPEELAELMNRYYEQLFDPVRCHSGSVSDVIGDAMMAIWTSPETGIEKREQACLAALDIVSNIKEVDSNNSDFALPTRIGLHYGQMMVGNIGALNHYEYRAVGDIINTASRIEGLNKHLGTHILVSGETIDGLDTVSSRHLGEFILKGKTKPIEIYELIGKNKANSHNSTLLCDEFSQALNMFRQKAWSEASDIFTQLYNKYDKDGPSEFYANQCETFKIKPPEEDWSGVIVMDKK